MPTVSPGSAAARGSPQNALMPGQLAPDRELVDGLGALVRDHDSRDSARGGSGRCSALMPAPPSMSRQSRAMSIAMRQLFHLASETCAGCICAGVLQAPELQRRAAAPCVIRRAISASRAAWPGSRRAGG